MEEGCQPGDSLLNGAVSSRKALQVKEEGRMASVKEVQCKKDSSAIAGFEDGRGP